VSSTTLNSVLSKSLQINLPFILLTYRYIIVYLYERKINMGRKRLKGFVEMKMLASRVEASDYYQFEAVIKKDGKKLQEVMNQFVRL